MRRKTLLLVIISLVITMTSCYTVTGDLTNEQIYLAADREFTLTLKQYNDWYDRQTPEVQAVWKEKIDPLFLAGNSTLDTWKSAITIGFSGEVEEAELLRIKSELLNLLFQAGVFKEE